jgi:hypothetical protein
VTSPPRERAAARCWGRERKGCIVSLAHHHQTQGTSPDCPEEKGKPPEPEGGARQAAVQYTGGVW